MASEVSGAEDSELARLQRQYGQLEAQLEAKGAELNLLRARFARYETALRGSHVTVYTQDRNLRYTSVSDTMLGRSVDEILGCSDEEILPPDSAAAIVALKREALDERRAATCGSRHRQRGRPALARFAYRAAAQ